MPRYIPAREMNIGNSTPRFATIEAVMSQAPTTDLTKSFVAISYGNGRVRETKSISIDKERQNGGGGVMVVIFQLPLRLRSSVMV